MPYAPTQRMYPNLQPQTAQLAESWNKSSDWKSGGFDYSDVGDGSLEQQNQTFSDSFGRFVNNFSGATAKMQYEADQAQQNRDWQEYMSNTAYQRQIADMKAAGINPASINADGASTPTGAQGHASQGQSSGLMNFLAGLARSAIGAVMTKKMIEAGTSERSEYRKMMGEYYSAKQALAEVHESKNKGFSVFYTQDGPKKSGRSGSPSDWKTAQARWVDD